jgi:hypothetical protein
MTIALPDIHANLEGVCRRIGQAAAAAGRDPGEVRLIAVSKYMSVAHINCALEAGQHCFGENTVQDAMSKISRIRDPACEWHFIGHLQSNKAGFLPGNFTWLHTLDSIKLARKLAAHCLANGSELKVLAQVNIAEDPDKYGVHPDTVFAFVDALLREELPGISLHGLMTIGRRESTPAERCRDFSGLRILREACAERFGESLFRELSMGMSSDFESAIREGATLVRIGSAVFGPRPTGEDR